MKKFDIVILIAVVLSALACSTGNKTQTFHVDKPEPGGCLRKYSISIIYSGGITQDTVLYVPCICTISTKSDKGSVYLYLEKYDWATNEAQKRLIYETNAQIMLSRKDTLYFGQVIYKHDATLFFRDAW